MALTFRLRPATPDDSASLAAIELESFPDPSWTAADFLYYDCNVIEAGDRIVGFIVSRETCPGNHDSPAEREILNLAVRVEFRRLGAGQSLLAYEIKRHANLFLEVRESNAAAIQLYKNAGFTEISRRRDYYDNPVESAIVMRVKW